MVITNSVIVIFIVTYALYHTVTFHVWKWNKILLLHLHIHCVLIVFVCIHTEVCWFDNGNFSKNCQPIPFQFSMNTWMGKQESGKKGGRGKVFIVHSCTYTHYNFIIIISVQSFSIYLCLYFILVCRPHTDATYACYLAT